MQIRNKNFFLNQQNKLISFFVFLILLITSFQTNAKPIVNIQHWTTKKGIKVYFVERKQLPMVDISLIFDAGSKRDGQYPGLANLTGNMLNQGTNTLNANQIAAEFDQLGAQFNTSTNKDITGISLRSLTKPDVLQPALTLFSKIINYPSFPSKAFKRVQRNTLTAIQAQKQSPGTIATLVFFKAIYGNHPYGHSILGTQKSIDQITTKNLQNFYHRYYVGKNAMIAIVGNVDRKQAENIVQQITSKLPIGEKAPKLNASAPTKAKTVFISYPSNQDYIRIGELGINHHDPDFFPLVVANEILGGQSTVTRLFEKVRDQHGLVYGIGSYFIPLADKGPFVVGLQTRNSSGKKAIQISQQVIANYLKEGPTSKELTAAKKYITGGFPLGISSNSGIMNAIILIGYYHLPLNYLDTYREKINSVTVSQIKKALQQKLHPDQMITVIVGRKG